MKIMISISRYLLNSRRFFLLLLLLCGTIIVESSETVDLCGGNGHIDSHALNTGPVPWNVAKSYENGSFIENHYIDISPCSTFEASHYSYFIPKECNNSQICHKITIGDKTISRGYNILKPEHIKTEFGTVRVIYTGPPCDKEINYTISIRYICGNHLGHPSFPIYDFKSECHKILDWETSAACKDQKPTSNFGLNEMRCYVIDKQNRIRDLTPLIRSDSSYTVMSSNSEEFYINVCTDVGKKCKIKDSSACRKYENTIFESLGSYKWSDIKFVEANEQNKHEYVELTYITKKARCDPKTGVTKIRFICPKELSLFGSIHREPTLISDIDCEYIIEWVTDYACPMEDIAKQVDKCVFENVDFNKLAKTEFVLNSPKIPDNQTIIMNICGSVSKRCSQSTSICLLKNDNNKAKPIGIRKGGKFVKAENRLSMVFTSKSATCESKINNQSTNNRKYERSIIEFKCDKSALKSEPEFMEYSESDCLYKFEWRTNIVCPLFEEFPDCSFADFNSKNQMIQADLSSLRLNSSYYTALRDMHDAARKYAIPMSQEIKFNICGRLPSATEIPDVCRQSAACLIDKHRKLAFSIGKTAKPLTYNENENSFELVYNDGFDLILNRTVSTKIIFFCQSYNSQAYLVEFDEKNSQYVIEFNTVAACPLNEVKGYNCIVTDPITGNVFDLRPLKKETFYVVRTDDENYEFELNICNPIVGGSCSPGTAICQKELRGNHRNFSLGVHTDEVTYWNSMLNMTFIDGDRYNDARKTPRKSHISFICDPTIEIGNPEFIGEFDRSYSFIWYTSLACIGPVPKRTNCVYENSTHFIDLNPLSLERGNHFALTDDNSIVYINFCRSLNRIRDNQLQNCKLNSAACAVKSFDISHSALNLGEPYVPPVMSNDGIITIHYNNGDKCDTNESKTWNTVLKLICDKESGQDLNIFMVDTDFRSECTYEFMVHTPTACATKLTDVTLDDCIYTDERTNLSVDFKTLFNYGDREIQTGKRNAKFLLNICESIKYVNGDCSDSAICLQDSDQSLVSFGKSENLKVYFEENLHLRYSGDTNCDKTYVGGNRSADIEFICDPNAHFSSPVLYYHDECLAKFRWKTATVCSLKVPSCSIFDNEGNYYSLRPLSSLSHSWKVESVNPNEHYLINICKPLPSSEECGSSSAVCKCVTNNGKTECKTSIGKVSDHEITLESTTKHLLLTYEEDDYNCNGKPFRTQIQFQCSAETGIKNGPKFVNVNDCTHYFVWNTSFACPHNSKANYNSIELSPDLNIYDRIYDVKLNIHDLLAKTMVVKEVRQKDTYEYVFKFIDSDSPSFGCAKAAVCQTKESENFYRDIGSRDNYKFVLDDGFLHMIIQSNFSKCGRNKNKQATTKILFECVDSVESDLSFQYESDDCEYYFIWKTSHICPLIQSSMAEKINQKSSSSLLFPMILLLIILSCLAFFVHKNSNRFNIREMICGQMNRLRGTGSPTTADVNFRYHQLNL